MVCGARRQQMVRTAGDCRSHGRGDRGIEAGISESGRQCAEGTREGAPRAVDGEAHQEVKVVRRCYATRGPRPSETSSLLTYSRLARLVSFPLITAREPLRSNVAFTIAGDLGAERRRADMSIRRDDRAIAPGGVQARRALALI